MITILMASYNGEKYIADQIESILGQTETDWKLIIQDDCSTDSTAKIAQEYADKYPGKIRFVKCEIHSGSAKSNFSSMLKLIDSEYMMTCDQDDIWLTNKIELTMKKMHELETLESKAKPLLVHTDLSVVDEERVIIKDSLFQYQNMDRNKDKFNNLLVQNIVTGCTLMVNKSLLDVANRVPEQAIMHDWWFALIAAAFGKIGFVNKSTVLYRQHSHNEVGAKNARSYRYILNRILSKKHSQSALMNTYSQAEAFFTIYGEKFPPPLVKVSKAYASIPTFSKLKRIQIIHHYDFWKTGFARKCGQILFS